MTSNHEVRVTRVDYELKIFRKGPHAHLSPSDVRFPHVSLFLESLFLVVSDYKNTCWKLEKLLIRPLLQFVASNTS